jgi:thioredoxin 1
MKEIITLHQLKTISSSRDFILLDFSAKWCGPCKKLSEWLEFVEPDMTAIEIVRCDVDKADDEILQTYPVECLPTVFFLRSEDLAVMNVVPGFDLQKIKETMNSFMSMAASSSS